MTTAKLTEKQRQALEHFERARNEGLGLSVYARSRGLKLRELYDAIAALRRKGVVAPAPARPKPQKAFVAVRVPPGALRADRDGPAQPLPVLCRVRLGAAVIECGAWPPAAWVLQLVREPGADAA